MGSVIWPSSDDQGATRRYALGWNGGDLTITAGNEVVTIKDYVNGTFGIKLPTVHWSESVQIGPHPAGWLPAGVGDFNGDGTSDVAWTTRAPIALTSGSLPTRSGRAAPTSGPIRWLPAGRRWRLQRRRHQRRVVVQSHDADTDIWILNNGQWAASSTIGLHPPGYDIAGIGDFNNDGTSDVLCQSDDARHRHLDLEQRQVGRQQHDRFAPAGLRYRRHRRLQR